MTKKNSVFSKALSVVLTVVMVFGYVGLLSGVIGKDFFGTAQVAHAADVKDSTITSDDLFFIVPEVIYLKGSTSTTDPIPFQYYVNNNSDGTVLAESTQTTGKIYYSLETGSTTATISYEFLDASLGSMDAGTVALSSTSVRNKSSVSITGGSSPALTGTINGFYIRWTLSYTEYGTAKKAYAYTYVYRPYYYPVFAATRCFNERGVESDMQSMAWISGIHGCATGGRGINTGNFSPMGGVLTIPGNSKNDGGYPQDTDNYHYDSRTPKTGNFQNYSAGTGDGNVSSQAVSPTGTITVDKSRNTNFNTIPNFKIGFLISYVKEGDASVQQRWFGYYLSDLSSTYSSSPSSFSSGTEKDNTFYFNNRGVTNPYIASDTAKENTDEEISREYCRPRLVFNDFWNKAVPSSSGTIAIKGATRFGTKRDGWGSRNSSANNSNIVHVDVTVVDKAALRAAVQRAVKKMPALGVTGRSGNNLLSCYFDADNNYKWTAFQSAFTNAYAALTRVDDSTSDFASLASTLTNALDNLCTKVTTDANGGSVPGLVGTTGTYITIGTNQKVAYTPTYTGSPARDGYTFEGWSTRSDATEGSPSVDVGYNQTVYAVWKIIPSTATFLWDNKVAGMSGNANETSTDYDYNTTFRFPQNCSKPYYDFTGKWKVTTPGGNWSNNAEYDQNTISPVNKYGNVSFTAQYTPKEYTITFNPNGAGNVPSNFDPDHVFNQYIYTYESRDTLPVISRLGYTFMGWQPTATVTEEWDDSVVVWNAATKYTGSSTSLYHKHGDITLVAQWEPSSYWVTLEPNGGSFTGNNTLPYSFQSGLTINNNPVKTGYTFAGWKVTAIPNYTDTNTYPTDNRWVMHTVYGEDANAPGHYTLDTEKLGDVTLTAQWTPDIYTLIYNANGGTACTPVRYAIENTVDAQTGEEIPGSIVLPTPVRKGWVFKGWSAAPTDPNNQGVYNWTASSYGGGSQQSGKYGNVTLTAQWEAAPYVITLDVNGGDPLADNTIDYTIEASTALPAPTKTGFDFEYWEVDIAHTAETSTWYDVENAPRQYTDALPYGCYGNVTLKAKWTHHAYTLTKSGGSAAGSLPYYIDTPAFELGASSQSGYSFVDWTVNASVGNWVKDTHYTATQSISGMWGNVTLTANFNPITYYITYKDKDDQLIGEPVPYTVLDTITLPGYDLDGYTFGGWEVSGFTSGGGWHKGDDMAPGEYTAGQYYGDVTLTPILTAKQYRITFDFADAPVTSGPLDYTIESENTLPVPTKNGYDFAGWKVTTAAGNWTADDVIDGGTAVTGKWGSVTLTAQWTPKKFTITYYTGTYPYPNGITKQGTYNETAPDLTDAEKAKPADAQYTYTFDHWDPRLSTVTGEASYTAVYTETLRSYDVKWYVPARDNNGELTDYTLAKTTNVNYGVTPDFDGVPTVASSSASYSWTFEGWSETEGGTALTSLPAVDGPEVYYAVFSKELTPINVTWVIGETTYTGDTCGVGRIPSWKGTTPSLPDENGYKYVFDGWYPTPVVVNEGDPDRTYTAQFHTELQTYTVTLSVNGGETADPLSFTYKMGDIVTFPDPTRTGYTFAGWKLDAAVGTWPADTVAPAGAYTTNTLWGDVSFTAQWTPIEYTVSFNAASPEDVLPAALTYTIESTNVIPAATREGHELNGWIVSVGGGNWTQGATLAAAYTLAENYGNVTLTPVWQVKSYTITWISDDYTQTSEAEYGSAILAYTPISKMGYTADWDHAVPATMPAEDLTFRAVYTPVQYYIRVNVNGGSPVENFYYTIDGNNTLPTPTRDGADFLGWKVVAAQGNWSKNTLVAGGASLNGKYGNVSLTAQWDLEQHTVTWVAGDVTKETIWLYGAVPSYDGTPYKSPDATNSYVFSRWDKEIVPVTEDVTYTALFEATERVYTVLWVVDGTTVLRQEYKYGDTPEFAGETPTRPSTTEFDFTFSGWSPEVAEVTKDVTYYAQFDVFTKLQNISLELSSAFLNIDDAQTLNAILTPANASVRDVLWTSQNPEVAAIDASGKVTAVAAGITVIKVASVDNSRSAYCVVTVSPRHTSYLEITAGGISTTQLSGAMLQLSATLQPDNATDTGIKWSSGDVSVATVDSNGLVKFVGVGETDISAVASDGFSKGSIHVVTTTDETEVENEVKTYLVTFGEFHPGFKFSDDGEHYTAGRLYVAEGENIRFKLDVDNSKQKDYSVYANTEKMSYSSGYWYELDNIQNNMIIRFSDSAAGIGTPEEDDEGGNSGVKLTFFERLAMFFRKIVEFFRGLFKR